jgi:hypothetical protein
VRGGDAAPGRLDQGATDSSGDVSGDSRALGVQYHRRFGVRALISDHRAEERDDLE